MYYAIKKIHFDANFLIAEGYLQIDILDTYTMLFHSRSKLYKNYGIILKVN